MDDVVHAGPAGLCCRDDVEAVSLWLIPDGDVLDQGALITVDLANGVRLASLHQDLKDFAGRDERGIPAVLSALAHITAQVSQLVHRYEQATDNHPAPQADTGTSASTAAPTVVVVHNRDPDASCELAVFLDGVEVCAGERVTFSIDPGAGHEVDNATGLPAHAAEAFDTSRQYGPAVHRAVAKAYQQADRSAWSTS